VNLSDRFQRKQNVRKQEKIKKTNNSVLLQIAL